MFFSVRDCNTRLGCVSSVAAERVAGRFLEFCSALSMVYNVDLRPGLEANFTCPCAYVKALKRFCGGLIEGDKSHEWRIKIHRLSRRQRLSIAGSLFLFRKILPTPSADLDSYMTHMSTPSDDPDPEFLLFCRRTIAKIFRPGWDRNYTRLPERVILPRSSCVERGMSKGGQRALAAHGDSWLCRESFCEYVLTSRSPFRFKPSRVVSVETGGKNRIVSTPTVYMNLLRPLHTAMYDHLSRMPWLLRGEAVSKRFADFSRVPGEVYVSGDYESATDNLNTQAQEFILREVLGQANHVPVGIQEMALASLRMRLRCGDKEVNQSRGQLMGNLLSFPLLCLVNYLAFKFFVRRRVPVRINGDDIVFRATPEESARWMAGVGRSGLVLSKGKTMVDSRFFSLNSKFFEGHRKVRLVPVVRAKPMFGLVEEGVISIRDRFRAFAEGFDSASKEILNRCFLRVNTRFIVASRRSVRNGLGIAVSQECLEDAGLYVRETQYLDQARRYVREVPLSDALKMADPYKLEGWVLRTYPRTRKAKVWQKEHARAVLDATWWMEVAPPDDLREELKARIRDTGVDYSAWIREFRSRVHRVAKLCGVSRNAAHKRLSPYVRLPTVHSVPSGGLLYCPDEAPPRRIVFVKSVNH